MPRLGWDMPACTQAWHRRRRRTYYATTLRIPLAYAACAARAFRARIPCWCSVRGCRGRRDVCDVCVRRRGRAVHRGSGSASLLLLPYYAQHDCPPHTTLAASFFFTYQRRNGCCGSLGAAVNKARRYCAVLSRISVVAHTACVYPHAC